MRKELFLSLFQPKKGNLIDNNNTQILLPEIPFYGLKGSICHVEEARECYYKVLYNEDGTISTNKLPVPKKKNKTFNLILKDYCNDIENYLSKYQDKYLEYENTNNNPILTNKQFYLLATLTLLASLASLAFLFTTTSVGIIFSTISVTSLYIVCDIHKKDITKNKDYNKFKVNYKRLQRDLIEYRSGNPIYKEKQNETIYTEIDKVDKSYLKIFPKIKILIKDEA